jgi:hypothetical protein
MGRITRKQAEKVLQDIRERFSDDDMSTGPNLRDSQHEGLPSGSWSIDWEDNGWDWAIAYSNNHSSKSVFVEPINGYTLGIYPND